jgi:hypothetical protein
MMRIAILGWGSLIWDKRAAFDEQHDDWQFDGPSLKIEFSRVSQSRNEALTLVLDPQHGKLCRVAYALSRRQTHDDAICDLRCREGTTLKNIGLYFVDGSQSRSRDAESLKTIQAWISPKKFDAVIWTDLPSNFQEKSRVRKRFSVKNAISHIQALDVVGKATTAEYVWRAPEFIKTPLRKALESQPWFPENG